VGIVIILLVLIWLTIGFGIWPVLGWLGILIGILVSIGVLIAAFAGMTKTLGALPSSERRALAWIATVGISLIIISALTLSARTQPLVPTTPNPKQIMILPPVEYDRYYEGDLTIKIVPTLEELRAACNNQTPSMLGCAWARGKYCVIYMVEDAVMRTRGWNTGLVLRHEIGHCNGWAHDHPGQRSVSWPSPYWVPAHERR
jgi:hypothetical protein